MNGSGRPAGGDPLTIFAAGGPLPAHVARAAVTAGRPVFVVGLEGTADEELKSFPHEMVKWGQIGRMMELVAAHGTRDVVLIGTVDARPDFSAAQVDVGALRVLPRIMSMLVGGDDTVLSALVRLLEDQGYTVRGAHEIARDLVAQPGRVAGPRADGTALADAGLAWRSARLIGGLDAGQAAVAVHSRVVALEGAEGTDAMVVRVGDLRRSGRVKWSGRAGVLAKCTKPQQDIRVDMPTIGAQTVANVVAAGLAGIVIEPGRVMIADREEMVGAARRTGTFVIAQAFNDPPGGE